MLALRFCVPGAQYSFWGSKVLFFLLVRSWGLHFWREHKINSRCYGRCVLSRWVLSQQREMRISWWLCNNSRIHLWLRKIWSLVVCPETSFYVTRTCKNDKNRQNTFFLSLKKLNFSPDKQFFIEFRPQFPIKHSHPHQKRLKRVQIWNKRIRFLLADDLSNIFNF